MSDTGREEEVCRNPTLIFGKATLLNIGLFEKRLKFRVGIGFDMAFIHLDRLHFEVRQLALIHEEMDNRYEIQKIRIDTDIVIQSRFQMQNIVLIELQLF